MTNRRRPVFGQRSGDIWRSAGCDHIDRFGDVLRGALQSLLRRKQPIIPRCHIQSLRCDSSATPRRPPLRLASVLSATIRACSQVCQIPLPHPHPHPEPEPEPIPSKLPHCDIPLPGQQQHTRCRLQIPPINTN